MQEEVENGLLNGYLSLSNTNDCTKLVMSFFTGQLNEYFTEQGINAIFPRELEDMIPVFEMVQKLDLSSRMKDTSEISAAWRIISNEINLLNSKFNAVINEILSNMAAD